MTAIDCEPDKARPTVSEKVGVRGTGGGVRCRGDTFGKRRQVFRVARVAHPGWVFTVEITMSLRISALRSPRGIDARNHFGKSRLFGIQPGAFAQHLSRLRITSQTGERSP